jgi:transketolase
MEVVLDAGARSQAHAVVIRRWVVEMIHRAGGGHFGGSLSIVDILAVLFGGVMRRPSQTGGGDRFVLSKGHAAPAYYAALASFGFLPRAKLDEFAQFGAALQGHPDRIAEPRMDFSTGSLGQGLSVALGMALVLRPTARAWVLLGDGECQEGQIWEAAMLGARMRVDNLTAIVDANGYQEWGFRQEGRVLAPVPDLAGKWRAFGWSVADCDGHDHRDLERALRSVSGNNGQPGVVIAHTVKGRGAALIEAQPDRFHCGALTDSEYNMVLGGLPT